VPPEAIDDLNQLAALAGMLPPGPRADERDAGVVYIGERGVETMAGYIDRVVDNAEFYWSRVFEAGGLGCGFEEVERHWLSADTFRVGPCGLTEHSGRYAYYCGVAGASQQGAIVVGDRWMYEEIYQRFGDHAEFAVASVVAHEMGHHVQDLLGVLIDEAPGQCCGLLSLQIELHADCLGGVWASSLFGRREIDLSTMEQATRAAMDAGDRPFPGQPTVDRTGSGAHGTPEERKHWFTVGFEAGRVWECGGAFAVQP
jgi:predicted metalloprotease